MLQQELRNMSITDRSNTVLFKHMSRGSIVILIFLASNEVFLDIENYVAAKYAVKDLVQTADKNVALTMMRID